MTDLQKMEHPTSNDEPHPQYSTVELIASGYEWVCPHCGHLNYEIEIIERVQCKKCEARFNTNPAEHTYG